MAFELRLTFSGLTALVPRKDVTEKEPAKEWLVVMPALQRGARLSKGTQKFFIAPHQAVMLVNARAVKDKTKQPRLRLGDPNIAAKDDHGDLLFQLDREVLQIDSGAEDETTKVEVHSENPANELADPNVPKLPDIADPNQLRDIKWVPPINECYHQGVPFDGKHIDSKTLRPSAYLAAVVRLNQGRLETDQVHLGKDQAGKDQPVPYVFRKGSFKGEVKFSQALAKGFRLRVQIPEDTARLILKDHKGNPKRIVVGPYEGCPTEDGVQFVEVKVFNRELEDILGIAGDPVDGNDLDEPDNPDAVNPLKGADTDFVIFYWFSPVWNDLKADDLVLPYLASDGGGGGSKPCEPPVFPGIKG